MSTIVTPVPSVSIVRRPIRAVTIATGTQTTVLHGLRPAGRGA